MLYRLQRHPFPVKATFRHSLVLTYALPAARLQPFCRRACASTRGTAWPFWP